MSSHREAPQISEDPVADSTDVYAFVSPDQPDTVTLIANYVPLQAPAGGPNFYEFGDDVLYYVNVDNDGDGYANIVFQFQFTTTLQFPDSFLYNIGPITSLPSDTWNRVQSYTVTRLDYATGNGALTNTTVLGTDLLSPPCNIGPLSTPDYKRLAEAAVHAVTGLNGPGQVFAGQRAEGFYVDLGAIFDLGDLRPFAKLHNPFGVNDAPKKDSPGVNTTQSVNVHSMALQLPTADLVTGNATIGVWTSALRKTVRMLSPDGGAPTETGPYVQVSRLGNPLFNEVLIPLGMKDYWNSQLPAKDRQFAAHVAQPELSGLLPDLYPGVFPNLATLNASGQPRADLEAILLTGVPAGIISGFQNYTGSTQADMLRLNTSIPPSSDPNTLGVVGGDLAGFPNGRRVFDDVTTIELRALAGLTYPLVNRSYTPDAAASAVDDGVTPADLTIPYLSTFPYLGLPHNGYFTPASTPAK